MKEIIIPELEEEIKKLPKQYVDSESVCKRYPLRYYEVKSLARSCDSFRMMRQRGVIDLVKFEDFVRSQFYEEGEESMRRLEENNPELASAVNSGAKKYVRYEEGAYLYSMGRKNFTELAKEADAVRKIGGVCLVSVEKLNQYIEEESK